MFERRIIPMYLTLCAVALAVWSGLAPDVVPALTLGWILSSLVALYGVTLALDHATRMTAAMPHLVDEPPTVFVARPGRAVTKLIGGDPRR
jgi:hypothetical protein